MTTGKRVPVILAVLVFLGSAGIPLARAGDAYFGTHDTTDQFRVSQVETAEMQAALPFSDTAHRPIDMNPGTVISTANNGLWVVTAGSYHRSPGESENVYLYESAGEVVMSFLTTGASVTVVQMPDPSPVISSTTRPVDMNPGTVLSLQNGQVWQVTAGSYHRSPAASEGVIVFWMQGKYFMSFQSTGAAMEVAWLSGPTPTKWRSGEVDAGNSWKWLNWFGYYNTTYYPWLYHTQHGWLYAYDDGAGGVFFWYNDMQKFVWTTPTNYPVLYRWGGGDTWLWYLKDSANPRWFMNYGTGVWESL